jgi:hypothetical protein
MNRDFVTVIKKLIAEQGKEVLSNIAKQKALLADYTRGEYKKESRLFLQALEAGVQKAIETADDLEICKKQQIRVLREEHFLAEEVAADIVDMLFLVLKGQESESGKQIPSQTAVNTFHQNTQPILTNEKRQRHFLLTCWLILGIIFFGVLIIVNIELLLEIDITNTYHITSFIFFTLETLIFLLFYIGSIQLLRWMKLGFKIIVVTTFFHLLLGILGISILFLSLYIFLVKNIVILIFILTIWALLKIRKNGKSTWEQLE